MENTLRPEIAAKYQRLLTLMYPGNTLHMPFVQGEVATLRADLLASGESQADIDAHVAPDRYDAPVDASTLSDAGLVRALDKGTARHGEYVAEIHARRALLGEVRE